MKSRRQSGLSLLMGLGLVAVACGSGTLKRGGGVDGSGGNGAVAGYTGLGASGGQSFGSGGSGNNGAGGIDACQAQSEPALLTPVNIVFIIDRSGSMGKQSDWDNLDTRWYPVRDALIAFLQNPGTQGLEASLTFFPDGGQPTGPFTASCSQGNYSSPDVGLTTLDDTTKSQVLVTYLNSIVPAGGTPTLPAVTGALAYATNSAAKTPGSKSVVVLVTDGEPGVAMAQATTTTCTTATAATDCVAGQSCSGGFCTNVLNEQCSCYGDTGCDSQQAQQDEVGRVAAVAQVAASAANPILTYVIGMASASQANMDLIAASGGTDHAFMVSIGDPAQTQADFTAALGNIRTVRAPCNIQMPAPPTNEQFDKLKVNVEFVDGNGVKHPLYYAGSLASSLGGTQLTCPDANASNPWYWTYDNEDNPTQIVLCASACSQTEGDANGHVDIAYGCATNVDVH